MTALEITRLCAEAMGLREFPEYRFLESGVIVNEATGTVYNPLHDDAQAMALVKKFQLCFFAMDEKFSFGAGEPWQCRGPNGSFAIDKDLNRCICLCVAKMQAAK